jgi:hypothetical protein
MDRGRKYEIQKAREAERAEVAEDGPYRTMLVLLLLQLCLVLLLQFSLGLSGLLA